MGRMRTSFVIVMLCSVVVGRAAVVTVRADLPATATRLFVPLRWSVEKPSAVNLASQSFECAKAGDEEDRKLGIIGFEYKAEMGRLGDSRYVAYIREEKGIPWLSFEPSGPKAYRVQGWEISKDVVRRKRLFDGVILANYESRTPVRAQHRRKSTFPPYEVVIGITINPSGDSRTPLRLTAGVASTLQAKGEAALSNKKLALTIMPSGEEVDPNTTRWSALVTGPEIEQPSSQVSLLTENCESSGLVFAVEQLASDYSGTTVAVVKTAPSGREGATVVAQLPDFRRVDLLRRTIVTRDTLLSATKNAAGLVVIVVSSMCQRPAVGADLYGRAVLLPMDERTIVEQLCERVERPPVVCFVTRQLPANMLFEKYVDAAPTFYLLNDPADPAAVSVLSGLNMSFYYAPQPMLPPDAYLSIKLGVRSDTISVLAFSPIGKLVYHGSVAKAPLQDLLYEARQALTK